MYDGVLQFMSKLVAGDFIAVRPDREVLQNLNDDDSDYEQVSYSSIVFLSLFLYYIVFLICSRVCVSDNFSYF